MYVVGMRPKRKEDEPEILSELNTAIVGIFPTLEEAKAVAKSIPVYFDELARELVELMVGEDDFDEEKIMEAMAKNNSALFFQYDGVEVTSHELSTLSSNFFPDPSALLSVVKKVSEQKEAEE